MTPPLPDDNLAAQFFAAHFDDSISRVTRFPTGLCHYVYEVVTSSGRTVVVRIATPYSRAYLAGGLYWHPRLQAVGVPLSELLASKIDESYSYMILERLPGSDLGQVVAELSAAAKQALATRIASVQQSVATMPTPSRFGFAHSYEHIQTAGKFSWLDVVADDVLRSEARIRAVGQIDPPYIARVRALLAPHETYLRSVRPVPFLDDTTTKNVIVRNGRLSGIVDTDEVCFGDALYTVGLTKMALLSLGTDTDYVEFWLDALHATRQQRALVDLYAVTFCLGFMGELGQTFNRHIEFDETRAERLRGIFEQLTTAIHRGDTP